MKSRTLHHAITAIAVAGLLALPGVAFADGPLVNIVSPTGTVYVSSFPANVSIIFSITHDPLKEVHVASVSVNGNLIAQPGDPFDLNNACSSDATTNYYACSTAGTAGT